MKFQVWLDVTNPGRIPEVDLTPALEAELDNISVWFGDHECRVNVTAIHQQR